MCCYHPLTIIDAHTKVARQVPCGKCIGCLQDYQNSWKLRLTDELKHYDYKGVYATLTYAPETAHVVEDAYNEITGEVGKTDEFCRLSPFDVKHDRHRVLTVWKDDVQKWLKRSRRRMERFYGYSKEFKYFITSEYGPLTLRPHYHCLFIGLDVKDFEKFFLTDWSSKMIWKYYKNKGKGRRKIGDLWYRNILNKFYRGGVDYEQIVFDGTKSPEACSDYVSKYCSKGFFENPRVERGYVEKTFHLVSKGIGYSAIESLKDSVLGDYQECSCVISEGDFSAVRDYKDGNVYLKDYYYGLLTNYNPDIHDKFPVCFESGVKHEYAEDKKTITRTWYDTIYALMPRLDYMRELVSRAFIVRTYKTKDPSGNPEIKTIKYKLPRYYYEKLFPKDSAIRKAVPQILQVLSDEKYLRELAVLRSEWPTEDDTQISHRYYVQNARKASRAENEAIRYVARCYAKSIL